jgi:1,2-phenylacetyl-CoA epoxidase PaaB subunit
MKQRELQARREAADSPWRARRAALEAGSRSEAASTDQPSQQQPLKTS